MSRHGFGRRRTVLQLGEEQNKREAYGFGYRPAPDRSREVNPIGGLDLMMNYEDSGEEEEEEEVEEYPNHRKPTRPVQHFVASSERLEPPVVSREPATSSQVTMVTNGRPVSPDTTKPKDEIDSKVLDFLAELDAIDGPDTTSGDGGEGAELDGEPLPPTPPHQPADDHSDTGSSDGQGNAPVEPKTDWQQCLDDGTQCYYYWNLASNEVTWEIPSEYSQYLLQYKEYEDQLAKYETELADHPPERRSKHKKKKKRKKKQPQRPDEEQIYGPDLPQSSTPSIPVQGPSLPPLPPAPEKPLPPSEPPPQALELPQSSQQDHVTAGPFMIGPQLPPPPPPPEEEPEVNPPVPGPELPSSSSGEPIVPNDDHNDDSSLGEDMDVDEYIHRKLEEPVYSHYEYVNKKYEGPQPSEVPKMEASGQGVISSVVSYEDNDTEEEDDLDIDDIDRELERALERKQAELQSMEVNSNMKRKAPLEDPVIEARTSHKKLKTDGQEHSTTDIKQTSTAQVLKEDVKRKVESLAKVVELTELVSDKLEFLEVTRTDLSRLQVLLIQVQTRIEDWKDGGLHTEHFVSKLQEAARQLEQYESSAAPPNWSCHWDRKFKRYFYCNDVTDDTQWDYPTEYVADPVPEGDPMLTAPTPEPPRPVLMEATDRTTDDNMDDVTSAVESKHLLHPALLPHQGNPTGPRPLSSDEPFSESNSYQTVPDDTPVPIAYPFGPDLGHLLTAPPPPPPPPSDPSPPRPPDPETLPEANSIGPQLLPPPPPPPTSSDPDLYEQEASPDVDGVAMDGFPFDDKSSLADTSSPSQAPEIEKDDQAVTELPEVEPTICGKPAHISAAPVIMRTMGNIEHSPGIPEANADSVREAPETVHAQEVLPSLSPAPPPSCSEGVPTPEETALVTASVSAAPVKEKKKKKDKEKKEKSLVGRGISMKKKNVTGLVQKWQKVQKEVESEIAKQHKEAVLLEKELEAMGNS